MSAVIRPRFYSNIALFFAAFVFFGFSRTYYLRFLSDLPPMSMLLHLHGIVATAWVALFVAQTRLIAARRVDLHMKLGIAGVLLAIAMIIVGLLTMAGAAAAPGVRPSGLTQAQFSAIPLTSTLLFTACVALALRLRHRADFHKRLMLLAMITILGPAVGRLLLLTDFGLIAPLIQPAFVFCLLATCIAYDWRRHHLVHPVFAWGGLVLMLSWPFRMWLAGSEVYEPVANWIAKLGTSLIS